MNTSYNLLLSWGGAIIDITALLLIFGITYLGAKQGFIKSLISTFGTILSLLFAVLLCGAVTRALENNHGTVTSVSNWLSGITSKLFGEKLMNTTLEEATSSSFDGSSVSQMLVNIVLSIKQKADVPKTVTLNQVICPTFAYYIVCAISLICIYFIFKMIFFVLADMTKLVQKVKYAGKLDRVLGATFGFLKSLFILDLILLLIGAIPLRFMQLISSAIDQSILVLFFRKINFINIIFDALLNNGVSKFINELF